MFFTYPDLKYTHLHMGCDEWSATVSFKAMVKNFLRTVVVSGHSRKLLMQSLFRHIQFKGMLCTHGEFLLGKQLQMLTSQSRQSAEHKLALQKKKRSQKLGEDLQNRWERLKVWKVCLRGIHRAKSAYWCKS